ncbi:hypothetical protein [Microbacterium protaetiae]|uniref:hypothetical protein n=1 Tax=Microbacterium protaetiae TaxID=2509458 RepID=UPI0013ECB1A5|nr:hypothetical protein [Microbacterium protaetiae]
MRNIPLNRRRPVVAAAVAGGAAVLLALAGCSSTAAGAADASASPAAAAGGGQPGQNAQDRGGVSGLIAAIQDGVLQVQGDDEQTAVRYTDDTSIQRTRTVTASDIAVGDCVLAVTGPDSDAATTITVTAASDDGSCTSGFGGGGFGGGGARPTGAPTGMPQDGSRGTMGSGMPQDGTAPSGAPTPGQSGAGGFGQFTSGEVTAVSADSLTVKTTSQNGSSSSEKVSLSAETTVTATKDASSSDIAEGLCVRATGTADDKGGYDATALVLSDASSDGTCTTGAGFGGRGQRPGSGGPGSDAESSDD